MDTADKADQVPAEKKRGRPSKKQDPTTPQGELRKELAREFRESKKNNRVVDTYYEMRGNKLVHVKKLAGGGARFTFVGSTTEKDLGGRLKEFIASLVKSLDADGKVILRKK
jgi:hypothetical protein